MSNPHFRPQEKGFSQRRFEARLPAAQQASRSLQAIVGIPEGSKMLAEQAVRLWEMPNPLPYLPESRKQDTKKQQPPEALIKPPTKVEDTENLPMTEAQLSEKSGKRSALGTPSGAVKPLLKKPSIIISKPEGETTTIFQSSGSPSKRKPPATLTTDDFLKCDESAIAGTATEPASPPPYWAAGMRLGYNLQNRAQPVYWYNKLSKKICTWLGHPHTKAIQTQLSRLHLKEVLSRQSITFTADQCEKIKMSQITLPEVVEREPRRDYPLLRDWLVLEIAFNKAATELHADLADELKASTIDSDEEDDDDYSSRYDTSSSSGADSDNLSSHTRSLTDNDGTLLAFPSNGILAPPSKPAVTKKKYEHAYLLIAIPFVAVTSTAHGQETRPPNPFPPTPSFSSPQRNVFQANSPPTIFRSNLQALPQINTMLPKCQMSAPRPTHLPFLSHIAAQIPTNNQTSFPPIPYAPLVSKFNPTAPPRPMQMLPATPISAPPTQPSFLRQLFPPAQIGLTSTHRGTNAVEHAVLQRMHLTHGIQGFDSPSASLGLGAVFDEGRIYAGLREGKKRREVIAVVETDKSEAEGGGEKPAVPMERLKGKASKVASAKGKSMASPKAKLATIDTAKTAARKKPAVVDTSSAAAPCGKPDSINITNNTLPTKPTETSTNKTTSAPSTEELKQRFYLGPQTCYELDSRVPLVHGRGVCKNIIDAFVLACARGEGVVEVFGKFGAEKGGVELDGSGGESERGGDVELACEGEGGDVKDEMR